jgi:hypothetical protein
MKDQRKKKEGIFLKGTTCMIVGRNRNDTVLFFERSYRVILLTAGVQAR